MMPQMMLLAALPHRLYMQNDEMIAFSMHIILSCSQALRQFILRILIWYPQVTRRTQYLLMVCDVYWNKIRRVQTVVCMLYLL